MLQFQDNVGRNFGVGPCGHNRPGSFKVGQSVPSLRPRSCVCEVPVESTDYLPDRCTSIADSIAQLGEQWCGNPKMQVQIPTPSVSLILTLIVEGISSQNFFSSLFSFIRTLSCLMENIDNRNMGVDCQEQLMHLQFFLARDFQ